MWAFGVHRDSAFWSQPPGAHGAAAVLQWLDVALWGFSDFKHLKVINLQKQL